MKVLRQAVVVVHGIGEQVPLETIRSFVGTAGPSPSVPPGTPDGGVAADQARVFSEPSPASLRCNDRIYVARWIHDRLKLNDPAETGMDEDERIPSAHIVNGASVSDFYEYYWAPRYRLTTFGQVMSWFVGLLKRPRASYSNRRILGPDRWWRRSAPGAIMVAAIAVSIWAPLPRLATLCVAMMALVAAAGAATFTGLLAMFRNLLVVAVAFFAVPVLVYGLDAATALSSVASGSAATLLLGWLARTFALTVGDAANYLSNGPDSVEENELVQLPLIRMVEQLHDMDSEDGSPRYERIVVVGHSLGAVIAYDAITLLWARRNRDLRLPAPSDDALASRAVAEVEQAGTYLESLVQLSASSELVARAAEAYRGKQRALFCALQWRSSRLDRTAGAAPPGHESPDRARRARWIVSDLVTLGSPLTYADAFLATHRVRLRERYDDRSLSRCPPTPQRTIGTEDFPFRQTDSPVTPSRSWLHQAAPFAATVWTNRYFDHDVVGGPVREHFGPGVDDQRLPGGSRWIGWMAFSNPHSSYWTVSARKRNTPGSIESLSVLRTLIRRHPTYLLRTRNPDTRGLLPRLTALLGPAGRSPTTKIQLEVRLQALVDDAADTYLPVYLPVPEGHLVFGATDQAIEHLLQGESTQLIYSYDPFVGPVDHDAARTPG